MCLYGMMWASVPTICQFARIFTIVRSIDILSNKEYNYTYQKDKLIRSVEYDIIISSDGIVTSKTPVFAKKR